MKRSESQKQTGPEWSGLMDSLVQSLGGGKAFHPYPAWVSCGLLVYEAPELGTSIPAMYTVGGVDEREPEQGRKDTVPTVTVPD